METYGRYEFCLKLNYPYGADRRITFKYTGVKSIQILLQDETGLVRAYDNLTPEEVEEIHKRLGLAIERMKEKGYLR